MLAHLLCDSLAQFELDNHMIGIYDEIETQPWEEVRTKHEQLLHDQISYLASHSAFYQERFDDWAIDPTDIQSLADLTTIPFTTKDDERRCQAKITEDRPLGKHQAAPTDSIAVTLSSSGTTGKPTYFGLTAHDRDVWETLVARAARTMGIQPGDTVVHAIGRPIVPGGLPYIEGFAKAGANIVPAGGGSSEQLLTTLQDVSPTAIHSTPSHLEYLIDRAPEILGGDLSELTVQTVIGGGEPGLGNTEIREKLKRGWDVSGVRDVMGLGDVSGALAAECPEEEGAHFIGQGFVHPELINPESGESKPIQDGAEGELVYTPLVREATPLLRFRSGDYVRILGTECACGRTSPRLRVIGRSDDMLIYKAQNVYPEAIREVVATVDGATPRMKVTLSSEEKVQFTSPIPIRVVADETSRRSRTTVREEIQTQIRNHLGVRVNPTLVSPGEIEISEYKTNLVEINPA